MTLERVELPYRNTSLRFRVTEGDQNHAFERQYYKYYKVRLATMRGRVVEAGKKRGYNELTPLEALQTEKKCFVVGTIIKRMGERPGILKELARDEHLIPEEDVAEAVEEDGANIRKYTSDEDYMEIEDDNVVVKLGGIDINKLATGCIIGLHGFYSNKDEEDIFMIDDIITPTTSPQLKWPTEKPRGVVALLSGLELTGVPKNNIVLSFGLFTRWINGEMATTDEERQLAASIDRVIIAGNSLAFNPTKEISSAARNLRLVPRDGTTPTVEAALRLDRLIANLTSKMRVDLMAGAGDPCSQLWPQQPIHHACMPFSSVSGQALGLRTNPYSFTLGGYDFLGTDGLNVNDILKMSTSGDSLKVMEQILDWQHIAPTAPDTIDAFPMDQRDPLIMERRPHIFFCGNQSKFDKKWVETPEGKTLLISVPRFSKKPDVVLLDLHSLEVKTQHFGISC